MAHEIGNQLAAIGGVDDFGVELGAVELARFIRDHRKGRAIAGGDDIEAGGELRDLVAVAHPHLMAITDLPQPVEQRAFGGDGQEGAAKFAAFAGFMAGPHFAAKLVAHHLLAITDAEDRDACLEQQPAGRAGCHRRARWRAILTG